jgi:hypothetical protein
MSIGDRISHLFGDGSAEPADLPKLDAANRSALSKSIKSVQPGERGWVSMAEAQSLFSARTGPYAFGQTDEEGLSHISAFADDNGVTFEFMPVEGRVYFTRKG